MDASDVGRYGTLSLLKRLDPDTIIASYPIDDQEITIGRDPNCSIRLYYPAVSALHCKLVFNDDNKAFLIVLGTNGVLIDGCSVYPAPAHGPPVTVPLPNSSTLDIHKKRFRFAYPPKHLRPALAALPPTPGPTDTPGRRRALRMSMIHSAHVFSPRPSADPRANLRVLQSPLKTPFRAEKQKEEAEQKDMDEIVLVESDHPRVVESDKDLVILDHVTVADPPQTPPAGVQSSRMPVPANSWAPPHTPARRPPRASLHRAVLIRSAQRAALRQEMQREEEMEVEEVEESIIGEQDEGMEDVEEEEEYEVTGREVRSSPMSGWRKSLEAVKGGLEWAFRAASVEAETRASDDTPQEQEYKNEIEHDIDEADTQEQQYEDLNEEQGEQENEEVHDHDHDRDHKPEPEHEAPPRPLGQFMTPQASGKRPVRPSVHVRYSMGGFAPGGLGSSVSGASGARRVRVVEPWKVTDLVVPMRGGEIKEEDAGTEGAEENVRGGDVTGTPRRERTSEEERRAIRERRKSALTTPDTFFNGQVPGSRRTSLLPSAPALPALFAGTPIVEKATNSPFSTDDSGNTPVKKEDGTEDMQVLLARMRQMVAGVKRRQSVEAGGETLRRMSMSPRKRGGRGRYGFRPSIILWKSLGIPGKTQSLPSRRTTG